MYVRSDDVNFSLIHWHQRSHHLLRFHYKYSGFGLRRAHTCIISVQNLNSTKKKILYNFHLSFSIDSCRFSWNLSVVDARTFRQHSHAKRKTEKEGFFFCSWRKIETPNAIRVKQKVSYLPDISRRVHFTAKFTEKKNEINCRIDEREILWYVRRRSTALKNVLLVRETQFRILRRSFVREQLNINR